jgi:hypothetical protein
MTGYPEENFPAFAKAQAKLTSLGVTVVSPHVLGHAREGEDYSCCLRRALLFMLSSSACGGIALPGWRESNGARIEADIFAALRLPVHEYEDVICALQDSKPSEVA